jgi:hypothetical protein
LNASFESAVEENGIGGCNYAGERLVINHTLVEGII